MWVMAALKSSDITWEVVDPVAKFGSSIWDLMKKMPTYAPIFPGWLSAQWLQRVWAMPTNALEKRVADQVSPFQWKFDKMFWVSTIPVNDIAKIRTEMNDWINSPEEMVKLQWALRSMAEQYWTNSKQFQDLLREFNDKVKATPSVSQHAKDSSKLFDWTWKLTEDWVRLLHNNNNDSSLWERAIKDWYWAKVWQWWASVPQQTSQVLPNWISKTQNWNTINVSVNKYWTDWNLSNDKVDITVKDWKVNNLNTLKDVFKTHTWKYNEAEFKKILSDIWITDTTQIEELVKSYFNR